MARPKKKVYVYQDGEFLQEFESMHAASKYTGETMGCLDDILKRHPHWSNKGYFYSYKELRSDQLPDFDESKRKIIPRQLTDYNVEDDDLRCYVPRKKLKARADLRNFVHARLAQHWKEIPAYVAKMERSYLEQLLNSI